MKLKNNIFSLLLILAVTTNCQSQSNPMDLGEGFAAFIVKDIDASIDWYTSKLGFEIVNETNLEERGIKQANLKLGNTKIELIESDTSIDPTEKNTKKGLIQGIFKVGFVVSNFNDWKTHLTNQELISENDIVENPLDGKRMLIIKDPDGNRIQLFEK